MVKLSSAERLTRAALYGYFGYQNRDPEWRLNGYPSQQALKFVNEELDKILFELRKEEVNKVLLQAVALFAK